MTLKKFTASYFRNYKELSFAANPLLNIFYGENAAGKTSLLEAIYYLGMGRSFRTRSIDRIIHTEADGFTLFGLIDHQSHDLSLGLERLRQGDRRLHVDGDPKANQAEAIKYLPLIFISTNSYRYFYEGPKARRNFLDWGVFHVKHNFYSLWQRMQRSLKQRNAGLAQKLSASQLAIWENEFTHVSEEIDQLRQEYVNEITPIIKQLLQEFTHQEAKNILFKYERGWPLGKSLKEVLASNRAQDQRLGYTFAGPQRADFRIYVNSIPAQDVFSQGQQKQVAYALYLAQGILFKSYSQRAPIYLIDDLPAELDKNKRGYLGEILSQLNAQVFVTGINSESLTQMFDLKKSSLFHVKQGRINAVL